MLMHAHFPLLSTGIYAHAYAQHPGEADTALVPISAKRWENGMQTFWKAALPVGGLCAIAAALFWSLYSKWLDLKIFVGLSQDQTFYLMVLFLVLTALIVGAILYIYFTRPPGALTISGNVLLPNGAPAVGAQVFVQGMNGFKETDKTGWFQFQVNDQKSWNVRAVMGDQAVSADWPKEKIAEPMALTMPKKPIQRAIIKIIDKDVRAYHWVQNLKGKRHNATSLYIPLQIENRCKDADIVFRDIVVRDTKLNKKLDPPDRVRIPVGENDQRWVYHACDYAMESIFNLENPIRIAKGDYINTAVMIQENHIHRPAYSIELSFSDDNEERYQLDLSINVEEHSKWSREVT